MNYHQKHLQSCLEPWFYGHILEIRPSNREKWPTSRFSHSKPYQLHLPYLDGFSVYRGPPHLFLFGHRLWYLLIMSISPLFVLLCMYLEKSTFSYAHTSIKKKKGVLNFEKLFKVSWRERSVGVRPRRRRSSLVRKGKGTAFELEGAMDWIVLDGFLLFESPPPYFKSVMHTRFWRKQTSSMQSRIKALHTRLIPRPRLQGTCPHCVCLIHLFPRTKRLTSKGKLNDKCGPRRGAAACGGSGAEKRRPSKTQKIKGKAPPFISPLGRRTSPDEGTLSPLPELVTTWWRGPPFSSQSR